MNKQNEMMLLFVYLIFVSLVSVAEPDFTTEPIEVTKYQEFTSTVSESISYCDETIKINTSEAYIQISDFKDQLIILLNKISRGPDFILKRSKTLSEAFNLTQMYIADLEDALMKGKAVNSTIYCSGNETYEKYIIEEFEQVVEIAGSLLEVLQQKNANETDTYKHTFKSETEVDEDQRAWKYSMLQIKTLCNIINLSSETSKVNVSLMKHYNRYGKTNDILDLEVVISLTKKIIQNHNEIIQIIDKINISSNITAVDNAAKSNVISKLLNISYWEDKLQKRNRFLKLAEERYAEDRRLLLLKDIIRPVVLGILFLIGMVGNGLLLVVFSVNKDMRVVPNMMVINLTLSDFFCLLVNVPLYILETQTSWTFGEFLCKFYRFSRFLTIGLSVYSVAVISMQRYLVLSGLQRTGTIKCRMLGSCTPLLLILLVWTIACILASPRAAKAIYNKYGCFSGTREDTQTFFKPISIADLIFYCIIPLLIVITSSGLSSKQLKQSVINMPGEIIGRQRAAKARVLSSNILLALTIVFTISYVPYFAYMACDQWLMFTPTMSYSTQKYISFFLYALIFLNACVNPIALYLVSRKYRRYMNRYILFCRNTNQKRKTSMDTNATSTTITETKM